MSRHLLDAVVQATDLSDLDAAGRRLALRSLLRDIVGGPELADSVGRVSDWIDGFGPLTLLMRDPSVTDVLVNAFDEVWVEREGSLEMTGVRFEDEVELTDLIERLVGSCGARVDATHPIADARLCDGSRLHVVLPPVSERGPLLSIRRFPTEALRLRDLVERTFLTEAEAARLRAAVEGRRTIVVSGATGAGKTTLANALLDCVSESERVVLVQEIPELRPACRHWVSLLTREANVEGVGGIDQLTLLRAALRMRPDRIVVGEVRGAEAAAALQAMSTGHEGSLVTLHARSAPDALDRFVELARMSPTAPSEATLARRAARAVDLVVHVAREQGRRKIVEILQSDDFT